LFVTVCVHQVALQHGDAILCSFKVCGSYSAVGTLVDLAVIVNA